MKKITSIAIAIALAVSLTGCSASIDQSKIDNFTLTTQDLTAVFPAEYNITDSNVSSQLIPCDVNALIEASGSKISTNFELDARISYEDPTYYRFTAITYDSAGNFGDLKAILNEAIEKCNDLSDNTFGDVNNFSSEDSKLGERDLESFGLIGDQVFQFTNKRMNLVVNKKTLYTDGTLQLTETFIISAGEKILLLTIKGRNYKHNSAEFEYLEPAIQFVLSKFKN